MKILLRTLIGLVAASAFSGLILGFIWLADKHPGVILAPTVLGFSYIFGSSIVEGNW